MSDPSTREEIRADAIARVAESLARGEGDANSIASRHWCMAEAAVDALGDLLPTGREWGVRYESVDYPPRMNNGSGVSTNTRMLDGGEMHARAAVANGAPIDAENRRVVSRYSHDWIEVSE